MHRYGQYLNVRYFCSKNFFPRKVSIFHWNYESYLRQDVSYTDLLQKFTFFESNRNVFAEGAKNQKQLWCITKFARSRFLYKKPVYKKYRFKHKLVFPYPLYNAVINFKENFINLTANCHIWEGIYKKAVETLTLTATVKEKPDINHTNNTRRYEGQTIQG